jgi:rhamnosyltransferase
MKPALCFVTYFPKDDFFTRVAFAVGFGYEVYIFDNSLDGPERARMSALEGVNYQGDGTNWGMGVALKRLMQRVRPIHGWGLYLDQDTWFNGEGLAWIERWLGMHANELVAYAALNVLAPKGLRHLPAGTRVNTPLMVSSGTLFQLENLEKTGWHNENWFLECVDYEWCGRALHRGFSLGYVTGCMGIDHEVLQPIDSVWWAGKTRAFRVYSWRRNRQFLTGLLYLFVWGLGHGQWKYAWACIRNFGTHVLNQLGAIVLERIDQLKQR